MHLKSVIVKFAFITKESENRYLSQECEQKSTTAGPEKQEILAEIKWTPHHCAIVPIKYSKSALQDSKMWFRLTHDKIIPTNESDLWERICVGFENSFAVSAKQYLILKRCIII